MVDWSLLQNQLGVSFNDLSLLQQAFVHRSYLNENPDFPLGSNERLEFLGDALLGFVVAEDLYCRFSAMNEGEMTKLRSALVRQDSLARVASSLRLGDYLYLGQGEEKGGGRRRARNLACALEALIGSIFIDQGLINTRGFILRIFSCCLQQLIEEGLADYKSRLQELAQAKRQEKPLYRLVEVKGPDHDRIFLVDVTIGGEILGTGWGKSKQSAEKEAARHALETMLQSNK